MSTKQFNDEKLIKLHQEGSNNKEIAKSLDIPYAIVCNRITELKLVSNYTKRPNAELVKELHATGLSNKAIARQLDFTQHAIGRVVKQLGLIPHRNGRLEVIGEMGKCTKCNELKPLKQFQHSNRRGYDRTCAQCYYIKRNNRMTNNLMSGLKHRAARCHSAAKKQSIPFDIDGQYLLDIYNKQNGKCFYTDRNMETGFGNGANRDSISVDRVIPSRGYVKGNVVLCCRKINAVKNDLSLEEINDYMPAWFQRIINSEWLNKEGYPTDR